MSETDFMELAQRCEKLEGPDRVTDLMIMCALDLRPDWLVKSAGRMWIDQSGLHPVIRFADDAIGRSTGNPNVDDGPKFTASIDAAMSLVPEGWRWELRNWPVSAQMEAPDYNPDIYHGYSEETLAATPAIALVVACLRARASLSRLSPPPNEVKHG